MNEDLERDLLRGLRGELGARESAALRRRLAADPELRALERRLAAAWAGLAPPSEPAVPAAFAQRVMARARDEQRADLSWSLLPRWAKLAATLALVVGIAVGAGTVTAPPAGIQPAAGQAELEAGQEASSDAESLGETYLAALEDDSAAETAGAGAP
jgi:anti-sigma factor RsiW